MMCELYSQVSPDLRLIQISPIQSTLRECCDSIQPSKRDPIPPASAPFSLMLPEYFYPLPTCEVVTPSSLLSCVKISRCLPWKSGKIDVF